MSTHRRERIRAVLQNLYDFNFELAAFSTGGAIHPLQ